MKKFLNIVNDNDEIIGRETRKKIHRKGLLHREIHVYFITPDKEMIFQHRAKDKDTFPDLLDATVGGHVEIGNNYEETAVKETKEETGVKIDASDLIFVNKIKKRAKDEVTGKINNAFQSRFVYVYKGDVSDLKRERGQALGFEVWPMEKMLNLSADDKARFIPYILEFSTTDLMEFIKGLREKKIGS